MESSFIALTDALIDQAQQKSQSTQGNDSQNNSTTGAASNGNPYDEKPFEDGKIKMKHINGRGGLSQYEKGLMLCC